MMIEERCSCGASLVVREETSAYRREEENRRRAVKEAWRQIDRWRALHAACRRTEGEATDGD